MADTKEDFIRQGQADVSQIAPGSNPYDPSGIINSITTAVATRSFATTLNEQNLVSTFFDNLVNLTGLEKLAASAASGILVTEGVNFAIIPVDTVYVIGSNSYIVDTETTILERIDSVVSLSQTAGTATIDLGFNHQLVTGVQLTITGAIEPEYNGIFSVFLASASTLTFDIDPAAPATATGVIIATATTGIVPVTSEEFGLDKNLTADSLASLGEIIVNVNNTARVDFDGISGGLNEETQEEFNARQAENLTLPQAPYNENNIRAVAREVNNVNDVSFGDREAGKVTVFITGKINIIPDAGTLAAVREKIVAIQPPDDLDEFLFVLPPSPVAENFTLEVTPNTTAMRDAVRFTLEDFLTNNAKVGVSIEQSDYVASVQGVVDAQGTPVSQVIFVDPTNGTVVNANEIVIPGVFNFDNP